MGTIISIIIALATLSSPSSNYSTADTSCDCQIEQQSIVTDDTSGNIVTDDTSGN